MTARYDYRTATPGDLDLICRHRYEMFKANGHSVAILDAMSVPFARWLQPRLANGGYFGWIAIEDQVAVGGLGMIELDWPPHPEHPTADRRGYILNVFVEAAHRGRGIAEALMNLAVTEGRRRGLDYLVLHASAMGRAGYEKMGWSAGSEMALSLRGRGEPDARPPSSA